MQTETQSGKAICHKSQPEKGKSLARNLVLGSLPQAIPRGAGWCPCCERPLEPLSSCTPDLQPILPLAFSPRCLLNFSLSWELQREYRHSVQVAFSSEHTMYLCKGIARRQQELRGGRMPREWHLIWAFRVMRDKHLLRGQ